MTCLLAIDTSTEACSVAILKEDELFEQFEEIPRQHARRILPMVQEVLDRAGLELQHLNAIAYGRGPGSFTGLRIASGVAQGLAFGLDIPVIPVSTLAALAKQAAEKYNSGHVFACLDARIEEVYWGYFNIINEIPALMGKEQLCAPRDVIPPASNKDSGWIASGNGLRYWERLPQSLRDTCVRSDDHLLPRAREMVSLAAAAYSKGEVLAPELAAPEYLRDKVTHSS